MDMKCDSYSMFIIHIKAVNQALTKQIINQGTRADRRNVSAIKVELKVTKARKESDKTEITPLAQFDSKGMFARKRLKDRNFSYEFGRLSKEMQDKLDGATAKV
ncbi:ParB family protein [Vibrio harveyi]|uniref:ParB family protein n=1 Tax=Vibrio harveyi TaxID=669 RepID=UPI003CF38A77